MLTLKALMDILHEPNVWLFEMIWAEFTPAELQDLIDETAKVVRDGGEKTWDGSRYRTDGGIFLRLLREQYRERTLPILKKQQAMRRAAAQEKVQAAVQGEENLFCPPPVLGQLIGKGGSSVAALRTATDCKIVVEPTGRVSVEGPEEKIAAARKAVRARICEIIQKTHAPYAEQVILSEFMLKDPTELSVPWEQALYSWVTEAVEHTPAQDMPRVLACMVPTTPLQVRAAVQEHLTTSPAMLGGPSPAVTAILDAIAASTDAGCGPAGPESLVQGMDTTQIECA